MLRWLPAPSWVIFYMGTPTHYENVIAVSSFGFVRQILLALTLSFFGLCAMPKLFPTNRVCLLKKVTQSAENGYNNDANEVTGASDRD